MNSPTSTPNTDTLYQGITGGFFGTLAYLIGGFDNLITTFAIFIAIDYFTGSLAGYFSDKLSSDRAFRGLAKKAGMISFAIVATQLDYTFGEGNGFLRGAVLMMLIGTEGISITENLARLGVPIPKVLYERLEQLKGETVKPNGSLFPEVVAEETPPKEVEKDGI